MERNEAIKKGEEEPAGWREKQEIEKENKKQ